ncbi:MAG TPA: sigma-54 dependent transcriptional regulator [Candidatus Polarisedimenticolaceae bacterium]|nr:sigma-54 dependent transcriptional regulator [Candidatus Polarisedimenticolaceae bacterium]
MNRVLVVEDEKSMRDLLSLMLRKEGYSVETADSGTQAVSRLAKDPAYDLIVTDVSMPGMTGLELLRHARRTVPDSSVILMTAYGSKETAIEALNEGAAYYVEKPFDLDEMKVVVRKTIDQKRIASENADLKSENQGLKAELAGRYRFEGLIGRSGKMQAIFQLIERVAGTGSTVMISGESGTGKELIARAVHYNSGHGDRPFMAINCGALPDELLESELFGHMKGSFTGAVATKKGLFEVASGGTIFLDEIGETTPAMQIKLLRVLQERTIRRVGGTEEIPVDVRVITATNQDLEKMVREKSFREDLFYRINVIPIRMPALREKPEDIPALAEHFLAKCRAAIGKGAAGISEEAMDCLEAYRWPGNVRELENVIERAVALEPTDLIHTDSLPREMRGGSGRGEIDVVLPESGIDLEAHLEDLRRRYMAEAMERAHQVQTRAAELLGMTFRSFRYFAKKYGLTRAEPGTIEAAAEDLATQEESGESADERHIRPRAV